MKPTEDVGSRVVHPVPEIAREFFEEDVQLVLQQLLVQQQSHLDLKNNFQ